MDTTHAGSSSIPGCLPNDSALSRRLLMIFTDRRRLQAMEWTPHVVRHHCAKRESALARRYCHRIIWKLDATLSRKVSSSTWWAVSVSSRSQ